MYDEYVLYAHLKAGSALHSAQSAAWLLLPRAEERTVRIMSNISLSGATSVKAEQRPVICDAGNVTASSATCTSLPPPPRGQNGGL